MPGRSILNRDIEEFKPSDDGTYREWVDYRQKLEFTEFMRANGLDLAEAANILFPESATNADLKNNPALVTLRSVVYKQPRIRLLTLEDINQVLSQEKLVGNQYLNWPNIHYIITGEKESATESLASSAATRLKEENQKLKKLLETQETTISAYKDLLQGRS